MEAGGWWRQAGSGGRWVVEAGGCDSLILMKATHYKSGGCKTQTADCRLAELRGQFGIFKHRVVRMLITAVSDFLLFTVLI